MEHEERLKSALADRYQIEREIGSGGMATVYLAQDVKHDRKVAVKVLKPELAAAMGTERFLAEIRTTANLQHSHILPLFDSGEADGFLFYVMPYVEGESLRQKLERDGQLPVEEAVRFAGHVADALDYAHQQGVIHRDIKPANILFQAGDPVVTDFGIALAISAAGEGRLTETGLSLGTPYYMSPEQATGDRVVGPASDIYSLGCVLYEMLVGEPPYTGSTAQAILGKIIAGSPTPVTEERRAVPPNVEAVVAKALEKLPADRFTSASDFAKALDDEHFHHGVWAASAPRSAGRKVWSVAGWVMAALLGVGLGIALLWPESAPEVRTLSLAVSEGIGPSESMALTPNGSALILANAERRWASSLVIRHLDDLGDTPVPESDDASDPAISPDGQTMAFIRSGVILLPMAGGAARTIARGTNLCCVRWGGDGYLYYSDLGSIYRVRTSGGEPELVLEPAAGTSESFQYFQLLQGGRRAILSVLPRPVQIEMMDVESGRRQVLTEGVRPFVTASGYLIFARAGGMLYAAPLDAKSMELTAAPVLIAEGVGTVPDADPTDAFFAVSASGDLAYWTSPDDEVVTRELMWVDRHGVATSVDTTWKAEFESVEVSPSGTRAALTIGWWDDTEVWLKTLDDGPARKLTSYQGMNRRPVWAPDETALAFISERGGRRAVYTVPADGIGSAELLLEHPGEDIDEVQWSSDGDWLIYRTGTQVNNRDIYARRLRPDTATIAVSARPGIDERAPTLSPDGRWVAYVSNETGRSEVWVRSFPDVERGSRQVSVDGGGEPVWSDSGDELFFRGGGRLVSVKIEDNENFATGEVQTLFLDTAYWAFSPHRAYAFDGHRDRFLMIRTISVEPARAELILVENFVEEVKAMVGR